MIRQIVDSILPDIIALNFADTVVGVVTTINRQLPNKDGKMVTKSFPAYWNDRLDACNAYSDYNDLVPNSTKKSIIYFEDGGTSVLKTHQGFYEMQAKVKLICWTNLKLVNQNYTDATLLKLNVIKAIPEFPFNVGGIYSFIRFTYSGEDIKSNAIFNKYTYNETEKQYLIYPFDYFALNYTVNFNAGKDCINDVVINPTQC